MTLNAIPADSRRPSSSLLGFDCLARPALSAMAHPATLASIALLLVNDHILKRQYPSALTGKLSDFAGLFFFPLLLATLFGLAGAVLGRILPVRRARIAPSPRKPESAARLCFAVTAVAFAAVKLVPPANSAVTIGLETLLGLPVRIVRDPTDLMALAALWPAWRLWSAATRQPAGPPTRRSLLALGLASLAALATSPCPPDQPISHLVSSENGLYALATAWQPLSSAFRSSDGGYWDPVDPTTVPADVLGVAATAVTLPKVVCVPGLDRICYRVAGHEQLDASSDGGATWQTAWAAPTTRRLYMQRVASGHGQLLSCGKTLDFRANDILVLGEGSDHTVLVALGNEGLLHGRQGQPRWNRISVGSAEATPERGEIEDLFPPLLIIEETLVAVLSGVAGLWLLSEVSWKINRRPGVTHRSSTPGKIGAALVVVLLLVMVALGGEELLAYAIIPLAATAAFIAYLWTGWLQTIRSPAEPRKAWSALGMSLLGGGIVGLVVWIPFALWVLGIIPSYESAVVVALAAGVSLVVVVWRTIGPRQPVASAV